MLERLTGDVKKRRVGRKSINRLNEIEKIANEFREQRLSDISIALLHICTESSVLTLARIVWYERAVFRRLLKAPQLRTVQIDIMPK